MTSINIFYGPVDPNLEVDKELSKKASLDTGIDVRACLKNKDDSLPQTLRALSKTNPDGVTIVNSNQIIIHPGVTAMVKTGIVLYLLDDPLLGLNLPLINSKGLANPLRLLVGVQVRPRSGLAYKQAISITNGPGTIDQNYEHELGVLITNHGSEDFVIEHGDRIAQIVPELVPDFTMTYTDTPPASLVSLENARVGGFGSTGVK